MRQKHGLDNMQMNTLDKMSREQTEEFDMRSSKRIDIN
jgi:hypothetical protein